MSTLILIERTRVLISEKISILKEDYKFMIASKNKINSHRNGSIRYFILIYKLIV